MVLTCVSVSAVKTAKQTEYRDEKGRSPKMRNLSLIYDLMTYVILPSDFCCLEHSNTHSSGGVFNSRVKCHSIM